MLTSIQWIFYSKRIALLILFLFLISAGYNSRENSHLVSGHFFGTTKKIGDYQIVFAPYPPLPFAGDNSTILNFSILNKDNQNVNNIFASLIIKNKINNSVVQNIPFKFYEFSDISFPYTFKKTGDYLVTLLIRINGDPMYSENPFSIDFDISASDANQAIPTNELIAYYLLPALAVIAVIVAYLRRKNKI
ncbi:MAG: hypothetical protein QN834_08625 [Nitrososphaeraceae archaeon]|nr:hypothetical protein [Nitrososphaeraceae archaeon]MDW0271456.1 hypothetical protein [Nitrososphaeraceae archaeon]MDW0284748.1 hypothetical protein [Nitrososphaeraceae archaeon]